MADDRITKHVRDMLADREIPESLLERVLAEPEQVVPAKQGNLVHQSMVRFGGSRFLLRVIVDPLTNPPATVTVYLTDRIHRYWRDE